MTVVASPTEGTANPIGVLLPEPHDCPQWCDSKDDGGSSRLPVGRKCRGPRDGVEDAVRYRAVLTATEHHPAEGRYLAHTSQTEIDHHLLESFHEACSRNQAPA